VRRQTYGYLPSCRSSPPLDFYKIIVLRDRKKCFCEQIAHDCYLKAEKNKLNAALTAVHRPVLFYHQNNVTLLLNCVAQTNTNLLELELNDSETPVSRTVYLISVANS